MSKINTFFGILITSFSILTFAKNPYQDVKSVEQIKQRKSDALFSELMKDPFLNKKFNEAQIDHLSTYLDKQLYYTMVNDPVISQTLELIEIALNERLRLTDAENLKGMTLITPDTGLDIFVSVAKVMRKLGFSEEQIKNAKIFRAKGPINAYTYGANKDAVSFVIFDGLLEKVSRGELEGVIAHELGHILQKHMLKQMSLNMLFNRVITLAMAHHPKEGRPVSERTIQVLREFNEYFMSRLESELAEHMQERYGVQKAEALSLAKSYHVPSREALKLAKNQAEQAMENLPPQVLIQSSQKFIISLVDVMRFLEVPRDTKFFFTEMAKNIGSSFRPNVEDLLEQTKIAFNIISREFETSADFTSVTAQDPYTSVRFDIKTGGGSSLTKLSAKQRLEQNAPTLRAETKKAVDIIKAQLELSKASTTIEEQNMIISTNGKTHPRDNIRVLNQIFYAQNPEILQFRNPFLRFVALTEQLKSEKERLEAETEIYQMRIQNFPQLAKQNGYPEEDVARTLKQFDFKLKALKTDLEKVAPYIPKMEKVTLDLISELGFESFNPRFINYVEYVISQRQIKKAYLDELLKSKNAQNQALAVVISNLKNQLTKNDPILDELSKKLSELKNHDELKKTLETAFMLFKAPSIGIENYDRIRAQIRKLTHSTMRESRDIVDLKRHIKTSADKSETPSLDSLLNAPITPDDHAYKALELNQCVRAILRTVN
ncbi:MAG: M48 family metalloprotease [Oligoflexia bacterium]|nr:M48 family metalloprotease [Oligoflexia bacterium]